VSQFQRQNYFAPPSAASNSRRPMVTVIRPSRARVRKWNDTTPRACSLHVRGGRMLVASTATPAANSWRTPPSRPRVSVDPADGALLSVTPPCHRRVTAVWNNTGSDNPAFLAKLAKPQSGAAQDICAMLSCRSGGFVAPPRAAHAG